ncbi:MAG: histidinol dehydrogenase [Thermomicrobiales bacterium]|nr:histidinol dehydrogenase [Thermomicrobiales bacterium]
MSDPFAIRVITDHGEAVEALTRRHGFEETTLSEGARRGIRRIFGEDLTASEVVDRILDDVRTGGDEAVKRLTAQIDGAAPEQLEVPKAEWETAFRSLDPGMQDALQTAAEQITRFHEKQKRSSWFDFSDEGALGQIVRPLERIGVYAPGGTAVYPSSLLMTAVPAKVAGVDEIVVSSPPHQGMVSPLILAAAWVAGVDKVFQIGGAQAIAAMAYGTESVPHVDKILGPGNIFVVLAKKKVYGVVAIDQLPGPTETLIVADDSADPRITAADMIAQAEHDEMASAILITTSPALAAAVRAELDIQLETLPRGDIAQAALLNNGLIIETSDIPTAMTLANNYAPEHLCLLLRDPWSAVPLVKHAGGIFVGEHSPEALGDYTAGPSHVMPTGGTARFYSPIHLNDFVKVINVAAANEQAVKRLGPATIALADAEGLRGHARAIEYRLESKR